MPFHWMNNLPLMVDMEAMVVAVMVAMVVIIMVAMAILDQMAMVIIWISSVLASLEMALGDGPNLNVASEPEDEMPTQNWEPLPQGVPDAAPAAQQEDPGLLPQHNVLHQQPQVILDLNQFPEEGPLYFSKPRMFRWMKPSILIMA